MCLQTKSQLSLDDKTQFDSLQMCAISNRFGLCKLRGKLAFFTIADSESEAPRIHLTDYDRAFPLQAAEGNGLRTECD
jgi:hypothetical protein